jgi:hypothetical protein
MGKPTLRLEGILKVKSFRRRTRGTETSQYPEERTSTETPRVVASEIGPGHCVYSIEKKDLERSAVEGESPVFGR